MMGENLIDQLLGHPVRLQPYLGHRSEQRLTMSARALRSPPPDFNREATLGKVRRMWREFASREVAELPVRLEIPVPDGRPIHHEAETDHEGFVHFDVELDRSKDHPERTSWENVSLHWRNRQGLQSIAGEVLVPGKTTRLGVISDVDDTIIETGITGGVRSLAKNWRRLFAQMPDDRAIVPGADAFYGMLGSVGAEQAGSATHRSIPATANPFFYVSSSPWNLYSYLVAFKRAKGLPLGPLHLRDWGFNRETLGSSSHGAHKRDAICKILTMHDRLEFALIGDDTQGDLPAFAAIAAEFPKRIAAIFIRRASGPFSAEEERAQETIAAAGVPLWLGERFDIGQDFLREIGLTSQAKTEAIVDTMADEAG